MTTRQTVARNALEPAKTAPTPPLGSTPVVVTDLDRTFTKASLALSPEALRKAGALRRSGARVVLVTGRPASELPLSKIRECFDIMVIEGGAVWGRPGQWTIPPAPASFWKLAESVAEQGHEVREGWASFSVPIAAKTVLEEERHLFTANPNVDRIDVTLAGVDKASGLRHALDNLTVDQPWLLAIGDGLNDVPLVAVADSFVAVANAAPELASRASSVAPYPCDRGFLWAVQNIGA